MMFKSNRPKKLPTLTTVLRRKQPVGWTQGGSSNNKGAKPAARDGEKKGKF
jgi:hypothetical protein